MEAGFQPRSSRLASPPQLDSKVLEATERLWTRRSSAGAKVAGKIQCCWPRVLGRQSVRQWIFYRHPACRTNLRWNVGLGPVPASLSTSAGNFVRPDLDARMALDRGSAKRFDFAWPELETTVSRSPSAAHCIWSAIGSRHSEQFARQIS